MPLVCSLPKSVVRKLLRIFFGLKRNDTESNDNEERKVEGMADFQY